MRDKLDRAHLESPTDHGTCGGWKETFWMGTYIKFGVNPMPLTPSSVALKFNDFILKKKLTSIQRFNPFRSMKTQWIQLNSGGPTPMCADGLDGS